MGSPKQLLNWGEKTIINHSISTARNTLAKEVIVVLGANNETVKSHVIDNSVSIVVNKNWKEGLGKSIAHSAKYVLNSYENFDGLLIVLADQPLVTSEYLDDIIKAFCPNKNEIIATLYNQDKVGVPTLFDNAYFNDLAQLSGDEGAKSILKKYMDFVKVLCPDFENLDIDTKAQYEILRNKVSK